MSYIQRRRQRAEATFTLESVFYELKPVLYLAFSVAMLKLQANPHLGVKAATFGVLVFSLAIIYGRLRSRGHIR